MLASTKFVKKNLSAKTNIKTSKREPEWVRRVSLQVLMTMLSLQHYVNLWIIFHQEERETQFKHQTEKNVVDLTATSLVKWYLNVESSKHHPVDIIQAE